MATTTAVAAAAAGVDARTNTVDDDFRMWHAYVDTGWWTPAGDAVRFSAWIHGARGNRAPEGSPFTPVQMPRRIVRDMDACTVEALTYSRRLWTYGVRPVTVEDLTSVELDADTAALHTWSHVEAVPRGPKDLHDIPASAFPRAGDPAPVALTPRVPSHHTAKTSPGGVFQT